MSAKRSASKLLIVPRAVALGRADRAEAPERPGGRSVPYPHRHDGPEDDGGSSDEQEREGHEAEDHKDDADRKGSYYCCEGPPPVGPGSLSPFGVALRCRDGENRTGSLVSGLLGLEDSTEPLVGVAPSALTAPRDLGGAGTSSL